MSIDILYGELDEIRKSLVSAGEISLVVTHDSNAAKTLLLGAASEFEHRLCEEVRMFSKYSTNSNPHICSIIEIKAINRQYHTWFDWSVRNANSFYKLFGAAFSEEARNLFESSDDFKEGCLAFLEIGRSRNLLVHNNFSSFKIEKTTREIFEMYNIGSRFVDGIADLFLDFATKPHVNSN